MSEEERADNASALRALANQLRDLAAEVEVGRDARADLEAVAGDILGVASREFGPKRRSRPGEGARAKILRYFLGRVGEVVTGEQLAAASGIQEWARRVRELRVEDGYDITELGSSRYRLERAEPDRERAAQWSLANTVRRQRGSAGERVASYLDAQVGQVVTREQIDYVSGIAEGSRRVRELRDEFGWPINSHIDEPGLAPGEYRLTSSRPEDRRDPLQRLYPESLRQQVFERDGYTCQECGRDRAKALASGDTRFYLEVHHKVAVADELSKLPKSKRNEVSNLMTLCHRDHLMLTAELQRRKREEARGQRA